VSTIAEGGNCGESAVGLIFTFVVLPPPVFVNTVLKGEEGVPGVLNNKQY